MSKQAPEKSDEQKPEKPQEYYTDMPVGEILRRAREHHGRSLQDVEADLRIRKIQIEAIETGDLKNLPGRVYAIGFVRSYAEYLGLDGNQMVSLFKTQSLGGKDRPKLNFPVPASESRLPPIWLVIVGIFLAVSLMVLWSAYQEQYRFPAAAIPGVEDPQSAVSEIQDQEQSISNEQPGSDPDSAASNESAALTESGPADGAATLEGNIRIYKDTETGAPQAVQIPPSPYDVTGPAGTAAAPDPAIEAAEEATPQAAVDTAIQPQPQNEEKPQRGITLNVLENSWVEIRDQENRAIVSRVLKAGDQYFVPDRPDLTMSLGNAGGIQILLDNKPLPLLGKRGEVRRNISLDLDTLKSLADQQQ